MKLLLSEEAMILYIENPQEFTEKISTNDKVHLSCKLQYQN